MLGANAALEAADRACGDNRIAARLLRGLLTRLVADGNGWTQQVKRLRWFGMSGRHWAGRLGDVLDLPGNLALIQLPSNRFLLACRQHERWEFCDEAGQGYSAAELGHEAESAFVEGVVLRVPLGGIMPLGVDSLNALWPLLRVAWAEIGIASLFVNVGQLLLPLFSMLIYDKVVSNGVFETLWALVVGMVIYLATDCGMRLVRAWATERISNELAERSDEGLWRRLYAQVDFAASGVARFLTHYRDLSLSRDFISSSYLLALADIPFLALYLVVIGFIAWPMLIVAGLLVTGYVVSGLAMQRQLTRLSKVSEAANTRKLAYMGELLGAFDVVRTVPGSATFFRRWRDLSGASTVSEESRRLSISRMTILSSAMMNVSTVAMLAAGAYLIDSRWLSVGGLIACNLLAGRAMGSVASLFSVIGKWQDFARAAERMERSLEPIPEKACLSRPTTAGKIDVIGLGKTYEHRPPAMVNVSFSAVPGERIALLGRPGAGKTTLLRSIAGLCQPDGGQILIDGVALDDIARPDRARWLAWKSQDPALFAGTLEGNLRIASGTRDEGRFARALWASCLEDELSSGRMNLGMHIAERGSNLSGGQRQKVALARAFAQEARILLLDEPTLGLDPDTERLLAARLAEMLGPDVVLVMTTHSVTMLGLTKRVIAMDGGRIVADGPREKLVQIG